MAKKKSKQEWDVRTNLNSSPDSQGTLFSGGKKYSAAGRFPRGYTPERRQEVMDSFVTPQNNAEGDMPYNNMYRQAIDTVSRSTIPVEHLAPEPDDLGFNHRVDLALTGMSAKHQGSYQTFPSLEMDGTDNAVHNLELNGWGNGSRMSEYTPIHELGHHHDVTSRDASGLFGGFTETNIGKAEGYADAYAQKHFVPRDQKQRRKGFKVPLYPSVADNSASPEFEGAYRRNRLLHERQFGTQPEAPQAPSPGAIRGFDVPLFPAHDLYKPPPSP